MPVPPSSVLLRQVAATALMFIIALTGTALITAAQYFSPQLRSTYEGEGSAQLAIRL